MDSISMRFQSDFEWRVFPLSLMSDLETPICNNTSVVDLFSTHDTPNILLQTHLHYLRFLRRSNVLHPSANNGPTSSSFDIFLWPTKRENCHLMKQKKKECTRSVFLVLCPKQDLTIRRPHSLSS